MKLEHPDVMHPSESAVLVAVIGLHRENGHVTVRAVAALADLSLSVTHGWLLSLRRRGLVDWLDGRQGTLRPLVRMEPPCSPAS